MNKESGQNFVADIQKDLHKKANSKYAISLQRFFKTNTGEYGEGDKFIGIRVPDIRSIAKTYKDLSNSGIYKLLQSPIHEERFCALVILTEQFSRALPPEKKRIYELYLSSTDYINNWDLVDVSAHKIVGAYLYNLPKIEVRKILKRLATSNNLWERRIAIIATAYFIDQNRFNETLDISKILLNDSHDLIHKAVGWMLREVGNRDREIEEIFLRKYYKKMPRTMLRYAIEKFPEGIRRKYLAGNIN